MLTTGYFIRNRMDLIEPQNIYSETECTHQGEYITNNDFLNRVGMDEEYDAEVAVPGELAILDGGTALKSKLPSCYFSSH